MAQNLQIKPGLWAHASVRLWNGADLAPYIFSPAMTAEEKQQRSQFLAQLKLPPKWELELRCQPQADALQQETEKLWLVPTLNCQVEKQSKNSNHVQVLHTCDSAEFKGSVTYDVQVHAQVEIKEQVTTRSQLNNAPLEMVGKSQSKWLGADCKKLPKGAKQAWLATAPPTPTSVP